MPQSILVTLILFLFAAPLIAGESHPDATPETIALPSGFSITPISAPNSRFELLNPRFFCFPRFIASGAIATAISPDQRTLLVLTTGFNRNKWIFGTWNFASQQYVFAMTFREVSPSKNRF
jgi:hypothetical protein